MKDFKFRDNPAVLRCILLLIGKRSQAGSQIVMSDPPLIAGETDFSHHSKDRCYLEKLPQYFGVGKIIRRGKGNQGTKNFLVYIF